MRCVRLVRASALAYSVRLNTCVLSVCTLPDGVGLYHSGQSIHYHFVVPRGEVGVDHSPYLRPVSIHHNGVDVALRYGYLRGRYLLFEHVM